jgi:DNA polymerase-3 subunit alpha
MSGHPLDDYRLEVENFTNCPLDMVERFKDRKLKIAGIVTKSQHRVSRKGTGWGIFTLQDFRGTLDIKLFNEQYKQYGHLFEQGEVLYLEGFYQPAWNGADYNFNVNDVRLMASIGDDMTESITLKIPVTSITQEVISKIETICGKHKGAHKLKLQIYDREDEMLLSLVSKAKRVKADQALIEKLSDLGVKYKLN